MVATEACYGWDGFNKVVIRFRTEYQRDLWIKNSHPEFPEDRQYIDEAHYMVRRVKTWTPDQRGFDIGTP
jgi:hypothetical protein